LFTPAVATNSLQLAVTGKGNKINVAAAQGSNEIAATPDESRPWWRTAGAVIAAVVGLLVAMAGGLFALMQAQGWQF
jgi:anti-sigma-K factor RskA